MPDNEIKANPETYIPPWHSSPTSTELTPEVKEETKQPLRADNVSRVLAFLIDLFLTSLISNLLINLVSSSFKASSQQFIFYYLATFSTVYFIYFIVLTSFFSQTLGKKLFGLKVINLKGERINFLQALVRETIGKFVSFIFLDFGFIWILVDGKGRGWHDKIAQTQLVSVKDQTPPQATTLGFLVAGFLSLTIWSITAPNPFNAFFSQILFTLFSHGYYFFGISLVINLLTNFIAAPLLILRLLLEFVSIDYFQKIDPNLISNLQILAPILPHLVALYPIVLYLSRKTRSLILLVLIVHLIIASMTTSSQALKRLNERMDVENKKAAGLVSEKQAYLKKLCFQTFLPTFRANLQEPNIGTYERFEPCGFVFTHGQQYVFFGFNYNGEITLYEHQNTYGLVALDEHPETKTIGGHEVKIFDRRNSSSPNEIVYKLIIGKTRIELTWYTYHAILTESEVEQIIASLQPI